MPNSRLAVSIGPRTSPRSICDRERSVIWARVLWSRKKRERTYTFASQTACAETGSARPGNFRVLAMWDGEKRGHKESAAALRVESQLDEFPLKWLEFERF